MQTQSKHNLLSFGVDAIIVIIGFLIRIIFGVIKPLLGKPNKSYAEVSRKKEIPKYS